MANTKKYVQIPTAYLSGSGVIVAAVNIVVNSFVDIYGNVLTMADFGDTGYGTIEPDTNNEESFTFISIIANANGTTTLGGIASTLAKSPYTASSGLIRQHSGGTKVVVSDTAAFWNTFANKANDETVTGKYTFPNVANRPILTTDTDTAVAAELITLGQLSRQAISGAANASTTVKGIVQLPTQAQVDAKTSAGSTGALLALTPDKQRSTLLSDYVADTGAANAYVITPVPAITAYTAGQIFSFKATNANTTTSTLNVSGLGVKTINKLGGATALASGDIAAGMVVVVEYDGTNFVMLNPVGNAPLLPTGSAAGLTGVMQTKNGTFTISASGTTTITTSFKPYQITLHSVFSSGTIPATSHGGYDLTSNTMWCTFTTFDNNGGVNGSGASASYSVNITYGTTSPAATTATINNITTTSFDVVKTFGAATAVVYWTAIGY
jgi:hypothetical protein